VESELTIYVGCVVFHVSLEGQIKEVMHKAFWDSLAESLQEDPPDYTHALVLLKEVKEVIMANFISDNGGYAVNVVVVVIVMYNSSRVV